MDMDFTWTTLTEKRQVVDFWWKVQQGLCCIFHEEMEPYHREAGKNPNAASIEHLIPKRDNGPNTVGNVRLAHRSCNNRLGAQWAIDEHQRLVESGEAPKPKLKRRKRPAYVFDDRNVQDTATGQPFVALDKKLVSLPRGATLTPEYLDKIVKGGRDPRTRMNAKAASDQIKRARKMTPLETAQWLSGLGIKGA
jgi:hypothetical protein